MSILLEKYCSSWTTETFLVRIKNPKLSGYCFYVNTKILGDFQICISVPFNRKLHFFVQWNVFFRPLTKYSEQLFGVIKAIYEVLRTANRFKQTVCHFFSLMITQRRSCKKQCCNLMLRELKVYYLLHYFDPFQFNFSFQYTQGL